MQRLVGRIVDLPFDEHEDVQPGNLWADVRVFSTLVDFLEDVVDVDGDETEWLDCVRQVFDRLDPGPRGVLQRVLADLAVEAGWRFELKNVADEVRRLAGDIPSGFPEPMPTEELRVFVRNAVTVNLALDAAIDEATADWD